MSAGLLSGPGLYTGGLIRSAGMPGHEFACGNTLMIVPSGRLRNVPPGSPAFEAGTGVCRHSCAGSVPDRPTVTQAFCKDCTRARISTEGKLYTCLFATSGHDLRALLRNGASDGDLDTFIRGVWDKRTDRYSEIRSEKTVKLEKIEMSYIGG